MTNNKNSKAYEWKLVILLTILWGTVGLDRLAIVYLFPMIMPEFNLNNAQAGALTSVLAMTWAVSTWGLGNISDRVGRKKILIPATIFFSLMSWVSGIAKSYSGLMIVRGLLGIGEGGVFSTSVAAISEVSTPSKRGLNLGIHQSSFPLVGIGLGAIIATQLTAVFGWRLVFFIVGLPSLIIAIILGIKMKESKLSPKNSVQNNSIINTQEQTEAKSGIFEALKYRNVKLSSLVGCFYMTWLFVFTTFAMMFLTQVRGMSLATAGFVMSGFGFGGCVGMILISGLSDYFGRRTMLIISFFINGISVLLFTYSGTNAVVLFSILFVGAIFAFGCAPIYMSLCTTESVPKHLAGSSVGIPGAVGEVFGAMVMPIVAGIVADNLGLTSTMMLATISPFIAAAVCFLYIETSPRVLAKRNKAENLSSLDFTN